MEYRTIFHTIDDDLGREMSGIGERGWYLKKAFEPRKYKDSDEEYILVIWERAIAVE